MFFSNQRTDLRAMFFDTWDKCQNNTPLTPLEAQIADVIAWHPEYHSVLTARDTYQDKDYLPEFGETNPFLHMSLHQAVREQVSTNRPKGIQTIFHALCQRYGTPHEAEHVLGETLAETMWEIQKYNLPPDEKKYLKKLKKLLK